ncbi:hypothetical protein SDC9_84813 [bioreactor metagenome]|uniref:DUF4145 domain-containing protein n=2 Tax=root TaxID=1 RepID=A0A212KDC0_9BACT|nr:DUF4145 domain-containing protein [Desulfovibrio desulfuricans]MCB6541566.1 DUF4145 domain-containing protein [Desulfovibrio desulfuricans]MCB6552647.1 DUF4145 domain-containing protein [Desulfovibrio desulfuricans]MCB6564427.1 DUF4145 domain-containing protein [Desulfovibrio desulfuricans]MCB7345672.1 DUF4145 domain-containing protein [Desulfovibrio desulfuricans]MCQ4861121.1 DUF4145 domain-containing protein [Desulfovibrio desulfuricans]
MRCPYCQQHYVISSDTHEEHSVTLLKKDFSGCYKKYEIHHTVCPNTECLKSTLLIEVKYILSGQVKGKVLERILLPDSISKIYPDYIPKQLREDYEEACKIVELSPKAAATLARRCLQGIIRDYFGITKGRLVDEVNALQGIMEPELWDAIDGLRKVGNIGAHMEKDVDLIINIEPEEARQLIWLIETLFDSLYVHREETRKRLRAIPGIAAAKDAQKKGLPASPVAGGTTLLTP